jgi:hypothetical protein
MPMTRTRLNRESRERAAKPVLDLACHTDTSDAASGDGPAEKLLTWGYVEKISKEIDGY